jgi:hypothetical protein
VLVSQGGALHGWSLYLHQHALHFSVRRAGKISTVRAAAPATSAAKKLAATLAPDGRVTLLADDRSVATGTVEGPVAQQPADPLLVGRDNGGTVADYPEPFAFTGPLTTVSLTLTP